jgi:hypothetical protein
MCKFSLDIPAVAAAAAAACKIGRRRGSLTWWKGNEKEKKRAVR